MLSLKLETKSAQTDHFTINTFHVAYIGQAAMDFYVIKSDVFIVCCFFLQLSGRRRCFFLHAEIFQNSLHHREYVQCSGNELYSFFSVASFNFSLLFCARVDVFICPLSVYLYLCDAFTICEWTTIRCMLSRDYIVCWKLAVRAEINQFRVKKDEQKSTHEIPF